MYCFLGGTIHNDVNLAFFGAYWFVQEASTGYEFSYRHIKRSTATE